MLGRPRLAVIGLGRMGGLHREALSKLSESADLAAVCDVDASKLVSMREVSLKVRSFTDIRELIESVEIAGCIVATATRSHIEVVRMLLDRGLHVFCEKPFGLERDSAISLGKLARARGLILRVGFWRRFSPPWIHAKRLIDSGAVGDVVFLRLSQWDAAPPPPEFCDPTSSGGLAIDCGVHEFDLLEWLTRTRVCEIDAFALPLVDRTLAEVGDIDNLAIAARLESGAVGIIDLSRNCRYAEDVRTEILGSDGAIFVETVPTWKVSLGTRKGLTEIARGGDAFFEGVVGEIRSFVEAIRFKDVTETVGAGASARALDLAKAAVYSSQVGQRVRIPTHQHNVGDSTV